MKSFMLSVTICMSVVCVAMDNDKPEYIPNASYFIYEGTEGERPEVVMRVPTSSKHVTFYTFDGNKIKTTEYSIGQFEAVQKLLDPAAPKPQPAGYSIKYWECWVGFGYKGVPGHFMIFHDKHGNQIESFRFEQGKTDIKFFCQRLDLSLLSFDDVNKHYAYSQEIEKQAKERHKSAGLGCVLQ